MPQKFNRVAWKAQTQSSTIQQWLNSLSKKEKFFFNFLRDCSEIDFEVRRRTANALDIPSITWTTLSHLENMRLLASSLAANLELNHQDTNRRLFATLLATFEEFANLTPQDLEEKIGVKS